MNENSRLDLTETWKTNFNCILYILNCNYNCQSSQRAVIWCLVVQTVSQVRGQSYGAWWFKP